MAAGVTARCVLNMGNGHLTTLYADMLPQEFRAIVSEVAAFARSV